MPICARVSKVSGNFEKQCSLKNNVKNAMKNRSKRKLKKNVDELQVQAKFWIV